ncbi:hypothetical protein HHI36_015188 [Cryptolaemus montrouzieri]|uniref:Uncharacterized protein n=1 Tax=Cryptolaemus montrouzieri TaxID=559131 RepID=A0ABD2N6B3_9CUCU
MVTRKTKRLCAALRHQEEIMSGGIYPNGGDVGYLDFLLSAITIFTLFSLYTFGLENRFYFFRLWIVSSSVR